MSELTDNNGVNGSKYIAGFVLAIILTLLSFIPVMYGLLDSWTATAKVSYLIGLALIQIFVQIVYFLHLNHGPDAKWNVGTMWFGVVAVFVIIFGTWWAMQHLNYNMMGGSGRVIQPTEIEIAPAQTPQAAAPLIKQQAPLEEQATPPASAPSAAPKAHEEGASPSQEMVPAQEAAPIQPNINSSPTE